MTAPTAGTPAVTPAVPMSAAPASSGPVSSGTAWVTASLQPFREVGVLLAADVQIASALTRLAGVTAAEPASPQIALAVALAARAPRHGHVGVDLAAVAGQVAVDADVGPDVIAALPWPDADGWLDVIEASPLVPPTDGTVAPLVVHAGLLYLERYRTYERVVARELLRRATIPLSGTATPGSVTSGPATSGTATSGDATPGTATSGIAAGLLTGDGAEAQRSAVEASVHNSVTVLVGGPGTGKTTTVAAIVATLLDLHRAAAERSAESMGSAKHEPPLLLALAAPTGKAAARLGEAFREAATRLPEHLAAPLLDTHPSTIHRLLRPIPGSRSSFRHHARNQLPHDVVIVDECSMVSLPLMARLLDALHLDARLVLVGDPGQLASVDAGSVLGDIAGPLVDAGSVLGDVAGPLVDAGSVLGDIAGPLDAGSGPTPAVAAAAGSGSDDAGPLASCVTVLTHSRRFPPASPLARLADAVRRGDVDAALAVLADPGAPEAPMGALRWVDTAADSVAAAQAVRTVLSPALLAGAAAAGAGDATAALDALGAVRVLCAHRRGGFGVERWNERIESWLADAGVVTTGWYPGRPVLVTANDHRNRLYNGDLGIVVARDGRSSVAFDEGSGVRFIGPSRLDAVETTHAMTIHKSQGSEFDHVVVLLPPAESRLATRELLYTAVTRARSMVSVIGDGDAIAAAIANRTERASRLRGDLWGADR